MVAGCEVKSVVQTGKTEAVASRSGPKELEAEPGCMMRTRKDNQIAWYQNQVLSFASF